ncbi:MAG: LysR family transcriptional regulator [Ornithinimicrobium sp.]
MTVDVHTLRWFQDVADGLTVTEVSELERTSQSGVSRALARLESEVGTPLLHRSGRNLRMTHAGAAFKHHVDAMMHQLDDGLAAVQQIIDPETGTVTLSYESSLGAGLVPHLIGAYRKVHPQVRFDVRPKRNEAITSVRARGEIELELSTLRPSGSGFGWQRLVRERLELAVPSDHPLADSPRVSLAQAAGLSFVALPTTTLLRATTDELCRQAGFEPDITFECEDLSTVRGYVAAGLGVAIMPASWDSAPDVAARRVHHVPLDDAAAIRDIGIAWSMERRLLPAAALFLGQVPHYAAELMP